MDIKEIKKALQLHGTVFTIRGINHITQNTPTEFEINQFDVDEFAFRKKESLFGDSMNISKFGTKRFYCFSYTPLGIKVTDSVNYSDIEILSLGELRDFKDYEWTGKTIK